MGIKNSKRSMDISSTPKKAGETPAKVMDRKLENYFLNLHDLFFNVS